MAVTLDPSAAAVIAAFRAANRPAYETMSPDEARATSRAGRAVVQPDPPDMAAVEQTVVHSPAADIPVRIYRPLTLAGGNAPVLVFFHGGGWVIGDLDSHDVVCRSIATEGHMIVVAVDYRLSPEHKFPAAVEDALAATAWVSENAAALGADPAHLFVGGDSAGGNLAAVVAIHARDHRGPKIAGQVLIYPVTELAMTHPSHRNPETSVLLTHSMMRWFRDHYISKVEDIDDWRASPHRVKNLAGLPPALVITAGADPLFDEGEEFSQRLRGAGVAVTHRSYPGQFHGFITMGRVLPESGKLIGEIAEWLKQQHST
jgi:acetyl esterase